MHSKVNQLAPSQNKNSRRYISPLVSSHKRKQDAISIWADFEHRMHVVVRVCQYRLNNEGSLEPSCLSEVLWVSLVLWAVCWVSVQPDLLRTLLRHAKRTPFPCTRHILEVFFSNLWSSAKSKPIFHGALKCIALTKE